VAIAAELSMYLMVPVIGYLCDRFSPSFTSFLSCIFFGPGYLLAAYVFRAGPPPSAGGDGFPFWVMIVAFTGIGLGTACLYLAAVTTCAKNFGRGKRKGLAIAVPIAAFGLSGMWESQVGSKVLYKPLPNGGRGDLDVFKYFMFLGILLLVMGAISTVGLRIVDEEELIDEAFSELERSGILTESAYFQNGRGYGAVERLSDSAILEREEARRREEEEAKKKTWLLNQETRSFLLDRTMWWFAAGFFLVTGPGESFYNNVGTIIGTLYPPSIEFTDVPTTPATQVTVLAITSTAARVFSGTFSDILAPIAAPHHYRRSTSDTQSLTPTRRFTVSRMSFLLAFSLILSLGQVLLASGFIQGHGERFWIVTALIGLGYGACFSLTPIIVSVVWGVENFGTNWGIVAIVPALGATFWGLLYSALYQRAASLQDWGAVISNYIGDAPRGINAFGVSSNVFVTPSTYGVNSGTHATTSQDVLCYGQACYSGAFWAMSLSVWIACGLWIVAWKGPGGWSKRGIAV
jgi:MFS family permease